MNTSFHFFDHEDRTYSYKIYHDVIKVFPVDRKGVVHMNLFVETVSIAQTDLLKAAIKLEEIIKGKI